MHGLVTDVCIKRKVRNWVDATRGTEDRMKIYVQEHGILNEQHQRAYTALGKEPKGAKQDRQTVEEARKWMCQNFYDIRTFGAVMTTGVNCGAVKGPVQLTFARSIDPVVPLDLSITRVAVTRPEDAIRAEAGDEEGGGKETEMGRKAIIPYGLYRSYGFFNPHFANKCGMSEADLAVFWQALQQMWDMDRSAARGMMSCQGLYIFSHENGLGKAPAHRLFDRIHVVRNDGVKAPRSFADYSVTVNDKGLPQGITATRLMD
jgi:CRISPR-associated protein Csd2